MSSIVKIIFDNLIKKKIVTFSKMEESFFLYKKLDKKIKLSQNIIKLNYIKESPFAEDETNITSIIDNNNLYLWFQKDLKNNRYLSESLLLFRFLVKNHHETICIFEGSPYRVFIIKNNVLVASFVKRNINENDILLLKDEYFLDQVEMFSEESQKKFLKKSYAYLSYNDLFNVLNLQINLKNTFNQIVKWLSLPLLLSSVILMAIVGGYDYYQKEKNEELLKTYRNGSKITSELKNRVNDNEELNEAFHSLNNEFKYVDSSIILSRIFQVSEDLNMTLEFIRIDDARVNFVVTTLNEENIPLYTTKLLESNVFIDVKNMSSQKRRKIITRAIMQATLKER